MIAKQERAQSTAQQKQGQNIEPLQVMGATINNRTTALERTAD